MSTKADIMNRLDDGKTYAVAIWCREDVIGVAQARGLKLTPKQADEVLELMEKRHDCEYGMTWTLLDSCLDEVAPPRKGKK